MPLYALWKSADLKDNVRETSFCLLEHGAQKDSRGRLMELAWKVRAQDDIEAMKKYHEYMGWEPYVPME